MPLNGCTSGVLFTTVVALLLLPAQYYVPDFYIDDEEIVSVPEPPLYSALVRFDNVFSHLPPLDLIFTLSLIIIALFTYICEWIQRKLMERRLMKLNQYLGASVERLRAWDDQQEQLEATLKMVQTAASEYNLLLYLLLHPHNYLAADHSPPSNSFFDKDIDDDLPFLRLSTTGVELV